jgi:type II secretory pathway component PulJ
MLKLRFPGSGGGFTLTELLVAALVGLLVLAGLHRMLVAGLATQTTTSLQTEVNRRAQVAMDDMVDRLRGSSGVIDGEPERIWFVDQDEQNVRYWVEEGTLRRYRGVDPGSYSGGIRVARNVLQSRFEYFDRSDQPVADPAEAEKVVVQLEVAQGGYSAWTQSSVRLRNK